MNLDCIVFQVCDHSNRVAFGGGHAISFFASKINLGQSSGSHSDLTHPGHGYVAPADGPFALTGTKDGWTVVAFEIHAIDYAVCIESMQVFCLVINHIY
jgi:hypothetical protein